MYLLSQNIPGVYFGICEKMSATLGLENRENLEKWEGIFQSGQSKGILSRLEKSGNFTQNTGKSEKIILEN